jgi:hypothetical protein
VKATNTTKTKNGENRQLHDGTRAKPTHQLTTLKEDASAHLKNVVYTNGEYRHLSNSNLIPGTTIMTSQKSKAHVHIPVKSQKQITRLTPNLKNKMAGKMAVTSAATRTGTPRFRVQAPHVVPHVPNVMNNRMFPSRAANIGKSDFYFIGANQKGFNHYIPNSFYINQRLPIGQYLNGVTPKTQSIISYPSNNLRAEELAISPASSYRTDSRKINTQRLTKGAYVPKTVNPRYMSRPRIPQSGLSGLSRTYTSSLFNGRPKSSTSNINTAEDVQHYPVTGARNQYFLSQNKRFPKHRSQVLKTAQRHRLLPKSYSIIRKPNLFIPQTASSTSNTISLSLTEKFKDSVWHHFLDERLSKEKTQQEKASKNDKVDSYPEYNWSTFSPCSVSCGRGVKERYRRCNAMECLADGSELQILPCFIPPCKGSFIILSV